MTARWTVSEDIFLASHFDAMGDYIGPHDLMKMPGEAAKRVKKLKACGAWDALKAKLADDYKNHRAYLVALGKKADVEMLDMAHPGGPQDFEDHS